MSNAPRRPPTPPHGPPGSGSSNSGTAAKAADKTEALPVGEYIGLHRVERGWVVCRITIQGDKIVEREVLSREPEPLAYATQRGQIEYVKCFMKPRPGVTG